MNRVTTCRQDIYQNQNELYCKVCLHMEFVLVTEAPQCNRMAVARQDTNNTNNNIQIYKIDMSSAPEHNFDPLKV